MKYWQKIYLSTLILFLAALNMGAYLLFSAAFKTSLESERERSFAEHGFICGALEDDIEAIQSRGEDTGDAVWNSLFTRYARYYESQNIFIRPIRQDVFQYTRRQRAAAHTRRRRQGLRDCR